MAITNAMCSSFKKELLEAVHNFKLSGGDTFNLALYAIGSGGKSSTTATLGAATTVFVTTGEVASLVKNLVRKLSDSVGHSLIRKVPILASGACMNLNKGANLVISLPNIPLKGAQSLVINAEINLLIKVFVKV